MVDSRLCRWLGVNGTSDVGPRWAQENGTKQGQVSHLIIAGVVVLDRANGTRPFLDVTCCCCCAGHLQPWAQRLPRPSNKALQPILSRRSSPELILGQLHLWTWTWTWPGPEPLRREAVDLGPVTAGRARRLGECEVPKCSYDARCCMSAICAIEYGMRLLSSVL